MKGARNRKTLTPLLALNPHITSDSPHFRTPPSISVTVPECYLHQKLPGPCGCWVHCNLPSSSSFSQPTLLHHHRHLSTAHHHFHTWPAAKIKSTSKMFEQTQMTTIGKKLFKSVPLPFTTPLILSTWRCDTLTDLAALMPINIRKACQVKPRKWLH